MKDISVIIVSWNAREFLRGCLHSIREFGGLYILEVIVVDNASSDWSPEMVAAEFPEVQLIRCKENLGFARANNLGIESASGRFLALVNSDVVVHHDCFQRLVDHFKSNGASGLVGPQIFGADGRIQATCRRFPTLWNTACRVLALDTCFRQCIQPYGSHRHRGRQDHEGEVEVEVLSGCFWLARREAVKEVGGLDERFFMYAEDLDWCKRFHNAGWKVMFVPIASSTHFGGGSSANAPLRYSIEMLRANLTYWRKYGGVIGQTVFFALSVFHCVLRMVLRGMTEMWNRNPNGENAYKLERSRVCLRWLLTGKGV